MKSVGRFFDLLDNFLKAEAQRTLGSAEIQIAENLFTAK